jgi:hypothetical protein
MHAYIRTYVRTCIHVFVYVYTERNMTLPVLFIYLSMHYMFGS